MRCTRIAIVLLVVALGHSAASLAQQSATPQDFRQTDYVWSQTPQLFQSLWQAARTQTVRIAVLGDSQETSPTSHGYQYVPRLNYEMWLRFGNVPETPVEGCFAYGSGSPADWLMAGACATPGPAATRLAPDQILPNVIPKAFSTLSSGSNVTQGSHGQLTMLEPDAIDVDPSAGIPTDTDYFSIAGTVKARIFAATNTSSGEVAYQARPSDSHIPSYAAPVTATGTLTLGLQSATPAVKYADTAALDFGGRHYMALEVYGSADDRLTDIVGMRFFNETHPEGVIIDTFSHGGYEAATLLADHANAGPMFKAFGFQAAVLHYGANEGGGVSAELFGARIEAIISMVRSWMGDPNFPIILIADVFQEGLTAAEADQYDRYTGAELAIAQADSHVMVINARRLTEDIGWNGTSGQSPQFLLPDGIHYTAHGAQVLAAAEVAAMMNEIRVSGCMADPGSVTLASYVTLAIDVAGATACNGYGQYSVAGSLSLNQPALKLVLANGFVPARGQQFKVLSWGSLSGSFGSIALPDLPAGLAWDTSALTTDGTIAVGTPSLPTIRVTSGATQSVTSPASLAPIAFTLTGTGRLTVTAQSSNPTLLPPSGITISSGCGSTMLTCTARLAVAAQQTGSVQVTFTVSDSNGQTAAATATIKVSSAAASGSGGGAPAATGSAMNGNSGGGSMDVIALLALLGRIIAGLRSRWAAARG